MNAVTDVSAQTPGGDAGSLEAFRMRAREWIAANLPDKYRSDLPGYQEPDFDWCRNYEAAMYRAGLTGITWPKAYGGQGLTLREHLMVSQEIGRVGMPDSVNSQGKELAGPIILAICTEEQKLRYLPRLLDMSEIWCQGFSEPEAGSDLAALRTKATLDGDNWRISGQKIWTSNGYRADRCLLLARTGSVEDRHKGLALFAVDMKAPGVRVNKLKSMDGKESFCEVFFDNVLVAGEDAMGDPDAGWAAAVRVLSIERATNRMYRAWRFENELTHLVTACLSNDQLAARLEDSDFRKRIASTVATIEVLKAYVEETVDILCTGGDVGSRGSLYKQHWSENHQQFSALGREMLANAPLDSGPVVARAIERFDWLYITGRAETIYAGTTEIQHGIIADRILELPRGR